MECNFPLGPCSQHDPFEFCFRHSTISVLIVTAKSSLKINKYIMKDFHLICIVLFHYRLSVFTFKKSSFCARDILLVVVNGVVLLSEDQLVWTQGLGSIKNSNITISCLQNCCNYGYRNIKWRHIITNPRNFPEHSYGNDHQLWWSIHVVNVNTHTYNYVKGKAHIFVLSDSKMASPKKIAAYFSSSTISTATIITITKTKFRRQFLV